VSRRKVKDSKVPNMAILSFDKMGGKGQTFGVAQTSEQSCLRPAGKSAQLAAKGSDDDALRYATDGRWVLETHPLEDL